MMDFTPRFVTARCLDCGQPLDGVESLACPECGRAFEPRDTMTFRRCLETPTIVAHRSDLTEAHTLVALLESHGIQALANQMPVGIIGNEPAGIWVNAPDAARASEVVEQIARGDLGDPDQEPPVSDWECPSCHEHVEGVFALCWQCQTQRPAE